MEKNDFFHKKKRVLACFCALKRIFFVILRSNKMRRENRKASVVELDTIGI